MNKRQQELFDSRPAPWELDDASETTVARVVFARGPAEPFDYSVPPTLLGKVLAGCRVNVPLGRGNRPIVGYCVDVETRTVVAQSLKPVNSLLDSRPLLSPAMLELTRWMADYYLCSWGQVLDTVVPAGVRGNAGTREMTFLSVPTAVAARITRLGLPPKQLKALTCLAGASRPMTPPQLAELAGCGPGPINQLRKKKLVDVEVRRVMLADCEVPPEAKKERFALNGDQQVALDTIDEALEAARHETILIHGVTGSGKTEVYIRAIERVIEFGRQAIVLVPEISLTPQTRRRFRSRFEHVAVLHSHLSNPERHYHWQRIAEGKIQVIVGARSAVFAPTPHLGLIVLDEEHEQSFKQDTAPRYHARDVALRRAEAENVPLVLGSATPALESYDRALAGAYRLVDMPRRVFNRPMPSVGTIDLRDQQHDRRSRGAISHPLGRAVRQALDRNGQVILLLNRRGFATSIQCPACGNVVKCPECDIALTHHREGDKAVCHYCDHEINAPPACPECGFAGIVFGGRGTQRLEAEVRAAFRDARCLRMDSDTMRKPGSHEEALSQFRSGRVDILLGTQMIAKGLDFPNVTLVGVINADTALHFPDFRAAERTFQLVTQVAGRTGRGDLGGRVLVQTYSPEHPAIQAAIRHDFVGFAKQELPGRREFGYPPYSAMIRLVARGPLEATAEAFCDELAEQIRKHLDRLGCSARLLGPAPAPIAKLRGKHRFHILLHGPDGGPIRQAVQAATAGLKTPEGVQWIADVDPINML